MFPELCDGSEPTLILITSEVHHHICTEQFDFYCPIENANY
jgi:hypothetical protein